MGEPDVPLKDASDMQSAIASLPQQLEEGYAQARAELERAGVAARGEVRPAPGGKGSAKQLCSR